MKRALLFLCFCGKLISQTLWVPSTANSPTQDIYRSGKVGIGTFSSPLASLETSLSTPLGNVSGNSTLFTQFSASCGSSNNLRQSNWLLRDNTITNNWLSVKLHDGVAIDASFLTPGVDTKTWWERHPYNDIQAWGNAGNIYMYLKQGRLGIGVTDPWSRLDVSEYDNTKVSFIARSRHTTDYVACIRAQVQRDLVKAFCVVNDAGTGWLENFVVWGSGKTEIKIQNQSVTPDAFNVIDVQNNAINFKVKTNGMVYAREVEIKTGTFPDYVFDKAYKRLSLPELSQYIGANKHLPGFENADYYITNGIKTSEMFVKQQEKIEELTLYIIELEKRLQNLEEKLK